MLVKIFRYLLLFLILVAVIVILAYQVNLNSAVSRGSAPQNFTIEPGQSVDLIINNLYTQELINNKIYFKLYIVLHRLGSRLQAGEYVLDPAQTPKELLRQISTGQVVDKEQNIKVIEGWNIDDIASYLDSRGFDGDGFLEGVVHPENYQAEYSFLEDKPRFRSLEGYLFPDTYRVYANASADDIIRKMLDNFSHKLDEQMLADIKEQGKTVFEIITMASIIEKEVVIQEDDDRDARIVSGIFWNRLDIGQALQSCATLAYILGEAKNQYSVEDTQVNSPYNTYQHAGLPPGPIGNPGLAAIRAAIYPIATDYNYFLSPIGSDQNIFASTYEEHLQNKVKYLK